MKKFLFLTPALLSGSSILDLYVNGVSPFNVDLPFTNAYYYTDVNTETGPTYFSGIPEAYGEPGNFVSPPGSYIIPDTPISPTPQTPITNVYNPPPEVPIPDSPESGVPEPNNLWLVPIVLVGIYLWRKIETL
jgi:hypothetical protein